MNKLKYFFLTFLILFILSPTVYYFISITQTNKRTDYPGKEIAEIAQQKWNVNYKSKISFVAGDEWVAGNLSYHLKSRPIWISSTWNFYELIGQGDKEINVFGKLKYIYDSGKLKLKDNVIMLKEANFTLVGFE